DAAVPEHEMMPRLQQAGRHPAAHGAETDERDAGHGLILPTRTARRGLTEIHRPRESQEPRRPGPGVASTARGIDRPARPGGRPSRSPPPPRTGPPGAARRHGAIRRPAPR